MRSRLPLQVLGLFLLSIKAAPSQMTGGMTAMNYRYALPLYLSGGCWKTTLRLQNKGAEERGVSLLVRGADGTSKKRLHFILVGKEDRKVAVDTLLPAGEETKVQAGSVIVVQEDSLGELTISGSAELQFEGKPSISVVESLELLDTAGSMAGAEHHESVTESTLTALSSVGSVEQNIRIACGVGHKEEKSLVLPAHGTVVLQGCEPFVGTALRPSPARQSDPRELRVRDENRTYFAVFAFDLGTGKTVRIQHE